MPSTRCSACGSSCIASPGAELDYRLRSMERLRYDEQPLRHTDTDLLRPSHPPGDPLEHRTTFVATEGELAAGGAEAVVWQQCGTGIADNPPVSIGGYVNTCVND